MLLQMTYNSWSRASLSFFVLLASCAVVLSDDPQQRSAPGNQKPAPPRPLVRWAFETAGKLQSGEFHGTWTEWGKSPIVDDCYGYQRSIDGLFRQPLKSFAVKRPVRTIVRDKEVNALYGLIRTPKTAIRFGEINGMIMSRPLDDPFERGPIPAGEYLDPRQFGLISANQLFSGKTLVLPQAHQSKGQPQITQEGTLAVLTWESTNILQTLTLEVLPDAVLARKLTRQHRFPDVSNNAWSPVFESQEVTWKRLGSIFVPVEWQLAVTAEVLHKEQPLPLSWEERKYSTKTTEVHLDWTRVNDDIKPDEFSENWFLSKPSSIGQ